MIYTITGTSIGSKGFPKRSRCFGYYFSFEDAERAVLDNEQDIHEHGYYPYAVIEKIGPGIHQHPKQETWYHWCWVIESYSKTDKSPCPMCCNWGIG